MANFVKKKPVRFKYFPFPYEIWAENNKSFLRSHVKKQHVPQHYNQDDKHTPAQLCDSSRTNINTGGDLLPARKLPQLRTHLPTQLPTQLHTKLNNDDNNNDNNNDDNN